jgi:hypothetical protein
MHGVTQIDYRIEVEESSARLAEVYRALANFVPTLRPNHHLAGRTTLLLDVRDRHLVCAGHTIVFRQQFRVR